MHLLEASEVKKSFDGVYALSGVSFHVDKGECVALVGENGAGKSTLMKILSGVWPHGSFDGKVFWQNSPLVLNNPLEARAQGISIIHQELCLFPELTVAENLFLTEKAPYTGEPSQKLFERVSWNNLFSAAKKLFEDLNFEVPADALVKDLSVAQRQLVEIARAVHHRAKLLILDEPTSALSRGEVQRLFEVIHKLKNQQVSFVYISHKLDEVFALADRIVVLRDGRSVGELDPKTTSAEDVIRYMVGRPVVEGERKSTLTANGPVLEVAHLSHFSTSGRKLLYDVSFQLHHQEILGISGLMGAGRSELIRAILGVLPGTTTGEITYFGKPVRWTNIGDALEAGVAFVPEDRKKDGLFLDLPVGFNLSISSLGQFIRRGLWLDLEKEEEIVHASGKAMNVKCSNYTNPVRTLSGGNQQKVLLAKVVARSPKVLLLDEPTRGIDVGAKEEIYEIIRRIAANGMSVIVVSSELPELIALTDRVLVMREGTLVGELANQGLTQEKVMALAAGGNDVRY